MHGDENPGVRRGRGGGPAGLSAALTFGRGWRKVVLFDSGTRHNARAVHVHGFVPGERIFLDEFREAAGAQMAPYDVTAVDGRAAEIERTSDGLRARTEGAFSALRANAQGTLEALVMELTELGYVRVNDVGKTSMPGVFAAGDLTSPMQSLMMGTNAGAFSAEMMNHALGMELLLGEPMETHFPQMPKPK